MPIYEFKCDACKTISEKNISYKELRTMDCHICNKPMDKRISLPAVHFKGSGFYATDYKGK